jgi:hypothetical protein
MSSWKWFLLSILGGGIVFWISDAIIPALDPNEQRGAVTVACPAVLIVFYVAMLRLRRSDRSGPSTAIFTLFGIWVLAPWFTMLAQSVRGSGFRAAFEWREFGDLLVSSFLPTRILEMVTLEGSVIALWLGTTAMIICHLAFERTRWLVPPNLWAALKLHHSTRDK